MSGEEVELIEGDEDVVDTGPNETPWEQLKAEGETARWYSRFLLYRDLGPTRTLIGSVRAEQDAKGIPLEERAHGASGAWRQTAEKFNWKERAEAWDEYRRRVVFSEGYASDIKRIRKLDSLAEQLEDKITTMLTKMGDPRKFSPFLVERYLQTLEALAKETGGRKAGLEISGPGGSSIGAIQRVVWVMPTVGQPNEDIDLNMPLPQDTDTPSGA